jgi:uncharacterized protein
MMNKEWYQFLGFLSTPPLWEDSNIFKLKQFSIPQVRFPEPSDFLTDLPSLKTNYVLGKRTEDFYSFLFSKSSKYNILAQRLQIFRNKITLGELDFILEAPEENKLLHLEVVYKFYIYDPTIPGELERWIGPNRKDSLLRKLDKLKNRQLPLLYKPETVSALERLGAETKFIEQQVSFLASLFLPRCSKQAEFPYINNAGIAGTWMPFQDFTFQNFGGQEFYIPVKQDWPIDPAQNDTWYSFQEILPQVQKSLEAKKSPLIWMHDNAGKYERFFIVWW